MEGAINVDDSIESYFVQSFEVSYVPRNPPVFDWLHDHVWRQGARWTTPELTRRASGETLNPAHFRAHLERRYLG